jgi:tyrosyl-tRNA synthetase
MHFIEELKWRGLYYDMIPETENYLLKNKARGYIGFDPTAPSLGIGNLVQIIILMHFQRAGHQPIALIGGATGMIGDPSGKSAERKLLTKEQLDINIAHVKNQLGRFLDFDKKENPALLINNFDWYHNLNVLDFLRNVGKHLTVNYMMAKDSVKSRLETGISYTEFSYQLLQAYDYYILNKDYGCKVQMGGSDQWGNLTAGVELIRKMGGDEAYAVTSPLVTKADGTKFGKTESGNVYLSEEMTSTYKFYQFWLNVSDIDAESFIKIFTFLPKEEIESLIRSHRQAPHLRILQNKLADEVTVMVHSPAALDRAKQASALLFGKSTRKMLQALSENELLEVFEAVPSFTVARSWFENGINVLDLLGEKAMVFKSKGEARRMVNDRGLRINKEVVHDHEQIIGTNDLLNNKHLIVQKGKKNYFLLEVE